MPLAINHNLMATGVNRNLSIVQSDLSKSLEKLASGLRINRAGDDAAGLAISEGLRSQVGGLRVASRNARDGISVVQTAEGALGEAHGILQRMRDLAVQAANDSNSAQARDAIQEEAHWLIQELGRISRITNFNGVQLLDGSAGALTFQVGADGTSASTIALNMNSINLDAVAKTFRQIAQNAVVGLAITPAVPAQVGPPPVPGTPEVRVSEAADFSGPITVSYDGYTATVNFSSQLGRTMQDVANTLNADAAFNAMFFAQTGGLALVDGTTIPQQWQETLQIVARNWDTVPELTVTGPGQLQSAGSNYDLEISFRSAAGARSSISVIDQAINKVSTQRATLGAIQNRFEHVIKSVNITMENLSASESRIRDADMAAEMVQFTRSQILSQAGVAMLAQANQAPNTILTLLR